MNDVPMMFAFSDDQFIKGMDVLGVTDKNDLYILSDATVYDLVATGSTRFVYQLLK